MTRSQPTPTWPFLSILVALFILSLSAPRSWEAVARKSSLGELGDSQEMASDGTVPAERPETAEPVVVQRRMGTPTLAPPQESPVEETAELTFDVAEAPVANVPTLAAPEEDSFDALEWPAMAEMPLMCEAEPTLSREPELSGPTLSAAQPRGHFVDPLGIIPAWVTQETTDEVLPSIDVMSAEASPRVASRPAEREELNVTKDSKVISQWGPLTAEESAARERMARAESTLAMFREPTALLESLDQLAWECSCSEWAVRVGILVRELTRGQLATIDEADAILTELEVELQRVDAMIAQTGDYQIASELLRLRHAVERRIAVWDLAIGLEMQSEEALVENKLDTQPLAAVLSEVDDLIDQAQPGWREYLMLDSLGVLAQSRKGHVTERSRELADQVLARLDAHHLTADQRNLVTNGPIASLGGSLQAWVAGSVAAPEFLSAQERYESSGLPSDAASLARLCNRLEWSENADQQNLASATSRFYRNANVRVAVTERLMDLLLPQERLQWQPVHDTIIGVPVRGSSTVRSNLDVDLVPDEQRLRLMLDISGLISASTRAGSDWGTVFNNSNSHYSVQQPLSVGRNGVQLGEASASVNSQVRLRGVETKLDGVPLLGPVAQSVVRRGQEKRAPEARRESEAKIRRRAIEEAAEEASKRLSEFEERFDKEVIKPLTALGLEPEIIEMKTSDERFTFRARIAGENQLGSHTPRPRAPSDSLASVQLHQSAVNNLIERLDLNGRDLSLAELHAHVLEKLGRDPKPSPESMPEEVQIRFAARDAVHIGCRDDQVRVTLAIEELSKRPRRWNNFSVHVNYQPAEDVSEGRLIREGTIQLAGRRLNLGSQIALRGVFSKIFDDEGLQLVPAKIKDDPRFSEVEVSQLIITDGWIAAALGPKRAGDSSQALRTEKAMAGTYAQQ